MGDDHLADDDLPELSMSAFAALQEFYNEQEASQKRFEALKQKADRGNPQTVLSMDMFSEDWNASQFWYSDDTAMLLAKELLESKTKDSHIAVISAPSVFIQLKNLLAVGTYEIPHIALLEFDKRFNVFEEFVHYDFQSPLNLPMEMKGRFDHIICDPPFLSTDCQTKAAMTVRWLSKAVVPQFDEKERTYLIVCTGERMEDLILKLHPNVMLVISANPGPGDDYIITRQDPHVLVMMDLLSGTKAAEGFRCVVRCSRMTPNSIFNISNEVR